MGRVRGGGIDYGLDGDRSPVWLHLRAGGGRERLRQGGRKVEERRRRRREKVGGGVIGTRGTQPLVKIALSTQLGLPVMGAMGAIGPQLELSRSVVLVLT